MELLMDSAGYRITLQMLISQKPSALKYLFLKSGLMVEVESRKCI
jgi:hypothetical protein